MTYVSRNPFARTELHRDTINPADVSFARLTCDWCGSVRPDGKLYVYQTESDGGRVSRHRGRFCCKSCHDSYHG